MKLILYQNVLKMLHEKKKRGNHKLSDENDNYKNHQNIQVIILLKNNYHYFLFYYYYFNKDHLIFHSFYDFLYFF